MIKSNIKWMILNLLIQNILKNSNKIKEMIRNFMKLIKK